MAKQEAKFGWLCDSDTTDRIRPALETERLASDESNDRGENGHIMTTVRNEHGFPEQRRCYVED